jgi:hypothetical protein
MSKNYFSFHCVEGAGFGPAAHLSYSGNHRRFGRMP